jgi:predicted O-methyltransferase YrrM
VDDTWRQVEDYFDSALIAPDDALEQALSASDAAGLPAISVTATQGKLLQLLARSIGARRILELGALGGYSAIWLGRALPADGRLITLELEPRHAEVATASLARAGLADRAEVRVGPALDSLAALEQAGEEPFDLVLIDADKEPYAEYLQHALALTHPGSLIVLDNMVRGGRVLEPAGEAGRVDGIRRAVDVLAADPRIDATVIQTVGAKGYDGFAIGLVTGS